MDEILKRFENTMGTASAEDDLSHRDLYKNWGKYGNQEERRNEILRLQKSNRENKLDNFRGILNLMDNTEEKRSVFKNSSQAKYQPSVYVPGFNNSPNFYYNNVLMLSEWMVEKPDDFSTNWFVAPCPKGTRTLVVASNGMTRFYSKYGQLIRTTTSLLPGGNRNEKLKNGSVLDGFYCKDTNTMYILDVLSWKNHIMADGEMEFRRYWLDTKFSELPQLKKKTKTNKDSYVLLPMMPCNNEALQKFMMTYPPFESTKLDGLLFYHKHGHYVAGETPLVGWLYPYMVPEVLCPDMIIHESYAAMKPENYVDQATFIQKFEEKYSKKKPFGQRSQRTSETNMEAEDGSAQNGAVEDDITEQRNDNTSDTATMETEIGGNQTENTPNENMNDVTQNGNNHDKVPTQSNSLCSTYDPEPRQPEITK